MATLLELTLGSLLAGWIVYPLVMHFVGGLRGTGSGPAKSDTAAVSVLIATRDSVDVVRARVANIEAHREEVKLLEIIVSLDYAVRNKTPEYQAALGDRVLLVAGDVPGGKAATLNAAVRAARGDVLIFTDSAQHFHQGAMLALVEALEEPGVGASTGALQMTNNKKSVFLRVFWAYELWLRRSESRVASIVAVTGALWALHRKLWDPLPAGLICDDLYVPLNVIRKGYRVVSCDAAAAVDPRSFGPRQELSRKVRTLTGMLQTCILCPWLLNPWANRAWLQFVCHKLLRIVTPGFLGIALLAAFFCLPWTLRVGLLSLCVAITVVILLLGRRLAVAAKLSQQIGWSVLFLCAPAMAVANAVRGKWDIWNNHAVDGSRGETTPVQMEGNQPDVLRPSIIRTRKLS